MPAHGPLVRLRLDGTRRGYLRVLPWVWARTLKMLGGRSSDEDLIRNSHFSYAASKRRLGSCVCFCPSTPNARAPKDSVDQSTSCLRPAPTVNLGSSGSEARTQPPRSLRRGYVGLGGWGPERARGEIAVPLSRCAFAPRAPGPMARPGSTHRDELFQPATSGDSVLRRRLWCCGRSSGPCC
jgi:hypothetical protein